MCICSLSTGSFLANPHFVFSLSDPDTRDSQSECSVVISLAQKPKNREHRPIGFRVYKVSHHLKHCAVCTTVNCNFERVTAPALTSDYGGKPVQ
jgi:hypothetical protein